MKRMRSERNSAGTRRAARLATVLAAAVLGACATPPPPPPPPVSLVALLEQPAEHALAAGLVDYDDGAFDRAETDFRSAITHRLQNSRDASVAYKHLAFIACAFNRPAECEAHFRAAFAVDPQFHLDATEIGHPTWGPVYRRVAAEHAAAAAPALKPAN